MNQRKFQLKIRSLKFKLGLAELILVASLLFVAYLAFNRQKLDHPLRLFEKHRHETLVD